MPSADTAKKKSKGYAIFGWVVFFIILVVLALFGYRTLQYYKDLKAGNVVELPNNSARITFGSDKSALSPSRVALAEVDTVNEPSLGAPVEDAVVTVVMFGDYECPFSKESSNVFRRLAVLYGDQARFVYRDFPLLAIHPNAFQAALAAECAREQRRFWEYYDRLYANSPDFGEKSLKRFARETGLDEMQFETCMETRRYERRVTEDLATAERLGLRGTPTFYFNGRKVEGSIPEKDFESVLKKLLK